MKCTPGTWFMMRHSFLRNVLVSVFRTMTAVFSNALRVWINVVHRFILFHCHSPPTCGSIFWQPWALLINHLLAWAVSVMLRIYSCQLYRKPSFFSKVCFFEWYSLHQNSFSLNRLSFFFSISSRCPILPFSTHVHFPVFSANLSFQITG